MIAEEYLVQVPGWTQICERYQHWVQFMEEKVVFSLAESSIHTKAHCTRVLLYALLIGAYTQQSERNMDALGMAAVFHDTRRQDDWLDVGHGQRAADYYQKFCVENRLDYDERAYFIMAYHDCDDTLGLDALKERFTDDPCTVLLYQIFKDADALDRFRLGLTALDAKYLRTEQAKKMLDFAKATLENETTEC